MKFYHQHELKKAEQRRLRRKDLAKEIIASAEGTFLTDTRMHMLGMDFLHAANTEAVQAIAYRMGKGAVGETVNNDELKTQIAEAQEYLLTGHFPDQPSELWEKVGISPGSSESEIIAFYSEITAGLKK